MKKITVFLACICLLVVFTLTSADHIDAPAVNGKTTDIADYYAFQSPSNNNNLVFAITSQGLLSPSSTGMASFDENVLFEINIDDDGDAIEDMVIQAIPRDGKMYVFGPFATTNTGLNSTVNTDAQQTVADITDYNGQVRIGESDGIKVFAGPRDDPFFFDLGAYTDILEGNAAGFSDPGTDTFAGTNVLALVVEVPKSKLGSATTLNTWVETKSK